MLSPTVNFGCWDLGLLKLLLPLLHFIWHSYTFCAGEVLRLAVAALRFAGFSPGTLGDDNHLRTRDRFGALRQTSLGRVCFDFD